MKVVLSVGGSLVFKEKPDVEYIKALSNTLASIKNVSLGITVGGGRVNGLYADAGRALGLNNFDLDELSIKTTHANAYLLKAAVKGSEIAWGIEDASRLFGTRTVVMGGTHPGHTTDAVAALLAERVGAGRFVNLTNVSGIYDKDPNKHRDAKKFDKMGFEQLVGRAAEQDKRGAREHFVIDLLATKIVARSKIETHIVDGSKLDDVKSAILGKPHSGTVVK